MVFLKWVCPQTKEYAQVSQKIVTLPSLLQEAKNIGL